MKNKELKKIFVNKRIDLDIKQKDMALKLDVSIQFLSMIENGDKKMPKDFLEKLFVEFDFSGCEMGVLMRHFIDGIFKLPFENSINPQVVDKLKEIQTEIVFDALMRKERKQGELSVFDLSQIINQILKMGA